jgi:hypothetical protein
VAGEEDYTTLYVTFIVLGSLFILLIAVVLCLRHSDVEKDKKWKSKYMEDRLRQIEQQAKPI